MEDTVTSQPKSNRRANPKVVLAVLILAGLAWFGYLGWLAQHKLVTLEVRNADVRDVIRKIEWQIWERVYVNKSVSGTVTLSVHDAPLEQVLEVISQQTQSQCLSIYPLYSTPHSLQRLREVLTGEGIAGKDRWTNLQTHPLVGQPSLIHDALHEEQRLVSLQIANEDLPAAVQALSQFVRGQIVPEDGLSGSIHLDLTNSSVRHALSRLARQIRCHWTHLYALAPLGLPQSVPPVGPRNLPAKASPSGPRP